MDDKFHRHAKVRATRRAKGGREALGVWTFWWSWCLDDPGLTGFVPEEELPPADLRAAAILVEVGLWERAEGGYRFHDFNDWNPRRNQVEAKREADRVRVAKKRNASRDDVARDSLATNDDVASTRDPLPLPLPSPSQPREEASGGESESESADWLTIAKGYQSRFESTFGTDWQQFNEFHPAFASSARWVNAQANRESKPVLHVVDRLLDGAFADTWMREHNVPPTTIAKFPAKYYGAVAAAPTLSPIDRLHAEIAEAAKSAHEAMLDGDAEGHKSHTQRRHELVAKLHRASRSTAA